MPKPKMFYGAQPYIFEKAKELRRNMTPAEELLWKRLKGKKLHGFKFRRQHPIAEFIADFYCHSAKLVVEVDGVYHNQKEQRTYDISRDDELGQYGITVIRFWNSEVQNNLRNVLKEIASHLDGIDP